MNALQRDLKKLVPLVESLGAEKAASDPHRQKFHIQPMVGWLNDPNGLCKIGDTYHAFFQYGPFDVNGGVKHWGMSPAVTCSTGTTSPRCFTPMSRSTATAFTPARPSSRTARCTCTTPATSSTPGRLTTSNKGAVTMSAWLSAAMGCTSTASSALCITRTIPPG